MNLAEVTSIYTTNSRSIADMLRESAESFDKETDDDDRTVSALYIQISESGTVDLYGWGKLDSDLEAIGYLHAAIDRLLRNRRGEGL